MLVNIQRTDKSLVFLLNDICNLGFRLTAFYASGNSDFHSVAVKSVHGISLGYKDFFTVGIGDYTVFAV